MKGLSKDRYDETFAGEDGAQMGYTMCKMCPGRIVKNKFSKLTADTSS